MALWVSRRQQALGTFGRLLGHADWRPGELRFHRAPGKKRKLGFERRTKNLWIGAVVQEPVLKGIPT